MKLLRIYAKLPPLLGGMEKHIFNLTKEQIKNNNKVTVFYNDGKAISLNDEKICKNKLHKIKPQFIGVVIFYKLILLKLFFKKKHYDIIHIHGDWSSLIFVKFLKKLVNAKLIVLSLHDQLSPKFTHQKLLPKLLNNVDLIFSTGYDTAEELRKLSSKKVIVQPSGINKIFFQKFDKNFKNDLFTIVTVANLFPKKNIELILEIAQKLQECIFIIVGDGDHRQAIEYIINNKKISNVKLVGFKTPEEVRYYYQNSDCYLLTSFAEGTPTSALEAIACGLPIVSSNAGGLGNIVKEFKNGFVIVDFDKNKFIKKLQFLKSNLKLRQAIFINNIEVAKNYSWIKVSKNITEIMRQKLSEKN
jgi:L-malate glycosyltransferase